MIHEVTGDILLSRAELIAHGVAPNDHFDSGLALALRQRFPSMVKDYRHWVKTSHPRPGEIWAWAGQGADGTRRVVSLLTQDGDVNDARARPEKATLSNVQHSLKALRAFIEEREIASVALPRLATGVGGLDWDEVGPLVHEFLGSLKIPVYVYTTYHANVKAEEAG
ncbi:MAG: macro domain-containing protein [Myxococcota bacterium]